MITKLWALVQEEARPKFLILLVFVCLGGFVELAGIAATANLMGLVATQGKTVGPGPLSFLLNQAEITEPLSRLQTGLVIALVILGFAHAYTILRSYLRAQFVWIQDKEISTRLFGACLSQSYSWFLQRNTAELHRLVSSGHFTQRLLNAFIGAAGQIAIASTLAVALLWADPKVALCGLGIVCGAYAVVRLFTHKSLKEKGGKAHYFDKARRVTTREVLTSIRFVKTTGREDFFLKEFSRQSEGASKGMVFHSIYVDTVRAFLEWVTFACILSLCVYLVAGSEDIATLLPRLTLYTMAGYRLIPAIHALFGLWSQLKFDSPFIAQIEELLDAPEPVSEEDSRVVEGLTTSENLLTLEEVHYRYPSSEADVLKGVSLTLPRGGWLGVVGTTGAGKTTLLDIISGLCFALEGTVKVGESQLGPEYMKDWQSHLGVVPQEVILLDDTISRNVAFGVEREAIDRDKVQEVCELAGLSKLLDKLPEGLDTTLGERGTRLSGGERQRVGIARALYRQPTLLLLDEATSALDQATEQRIIETLQRVAEGCTMVTVAHRLSSVQPCHNIVVLEEGEIVSQGSFDELLSSSEAFRRLALA